MSELRALVTAVRALREAREPFVSATVLAVNGSGYRKPGARMVATEDQWRAGSISGGCLERDVTNRGLWYTRSERAHVVRYDSTEDEENGTGCQGIVDVLIERHDAELERVLQAAERVLEEELPAVVLTVVRAGPLPLAARAIWQGNEWLGEPSLRVFADEAARALKREAAPYLARVGELEVLVECLLPPVHLYVFGTGHDAAPLVTHAKNLGWTVSVWDASPRSAARERFQLADHYLTASLEEAIARASRSLRSAAVVMGHHFARDRASLEGLLRSRVRYLGVLGSRARSQLLLEGLERDERVHAPIGLAIGAETPAEIALAIVAEIQRQFGRSSGPRQDVVLV